MRNADCRSATRAGWREIRPEQIRAPCSPSTPVIWPARRSNAPPACQRRVGELGLGVHRHFHSCFAQSGWRSNFPTRLQDCCAEAVAHKSIARTVPLSTRGIIPATIKSSRLFMRNDNAGPTWSSVSSMAHGGLQKHSKHFVWVDDPGQFSAARHTNSTPRSRRSHNASPSSKARWGSKLLQRDRPRGDRRRRADGR